MSLCWLILQNGLYYYFYQLGLISCIFSVTYLSFKDIIISNQFYANIIVSYIPLNNVILGLRLPRLVWNWLIDCIYLYCSVHENFLVFHLCVFLQCDLTSWLYTTVTHDKYQSLVTVIVFDGCFHARIEIEKFVIWFTEDRYPLLFFSNSINVYGDMAMLDSCSCYPPSNHLHAMHVLLFWKNRYKSHFLSIHSPTYKTSRAWLIQIDMWQGYGLRIAIILRLCVWVPV